MKASRAFLVSLGLFIFSGSLTWLVRNGAKDHVTAKQESNITPKPSKIPRKPTGRSGMPADVAAHLARIDTGKTPEDRLRATIHLAQTLPIGDLARWYDAEWFEGREDMQSHLFLRIIRARWLEADPAGLMDHTIRNDSEGRAEVATAWALRDPGEMIGYLAGLRNTAVQTELILQIGETIAKADPQLALQKIARFNSLLDPRQTYSLSSMINELARSSPDLLEAQYHAWPAALRKQAREMLARENLKRDFAGTVSKLSNTTDGKRAFMEALQNDGDLMKAAVADFDSLPKGWLAEAAATMPYHLIRDDPQRWLEMDLSEMDFSPEQAKRLRNAAISQIPSKDPEKAMAMLATGGMDEEQRGTLLQAIAANMARDKEKGEAWIASLTNEADIEIAEKTLASHLQHQAGKDPSPSELLASLAEKSGVLGWNQANTTGKWNADEIDSVSKEFGALPEEQKNQVARQFANTRHHQVPAKLRAEAVSYLLEQPAEERPKGREGEWNPLLASASMLATSWGDEDPQAASRWVGSLPSGEERLWAAKNLAARWADYEPEAARRWASSLPADEREQVEQYLDSSDAR